MPGVQGFKHPSPPDVDGPEFRSYKETRLARPRVLIADDEQEFLQTIALQLEGECEVVGTSSDGARAVALTTILSPDVVVLDISMPVATGIEAALCLRERGCRARILFLTVHYDRDFVEAALSAGGKGYVLKSRLITDLLPAIRAVMDGNVFISPPLRVD